jgi:chitinase
MSGPEPGPTDDPAPTGSDPTGSDPTGSDPTGSDPTGSEPTGSTYRMSYRFVPRRKPTAGT